MGMWGYGWAQSDDAYDLSGEVEAPMRKAWRKVMTTKSISARSRWYEKARAAAGMAILLRRMMTESDLEDARKALEVILEDSEVTSKFRQAIRYDIRRLNYHIKKKGERSCAKTKARKKNRG